MIVLQNSKRFVNDSQTIALENGGEMENYLAPQVAAFLAQHFGVVCEVEVKK
jgi:hypothetical protein